MKTRFKKLIASLHISWTLAAAVILVTVMLTVVITGAVKQDFNSDSETFNGLASYGAPNAGGTTYNLSEDDKNGQNVNSESDRQKEQDEEYKDESENNAPELDDSGEDVILPSDLANGTESQVTVDAPVQTAPQYLDGDGDNPVDGYSPALDPGIDNITDTSSHVSGGEEILDGNTEEQSTDPSPSPDQTQQPYFPPAFIPGGNQSGGGTGGDKFMVGGKEYGSIEDALAGIADNKEQSKNELGQYFEGFVTDENGNYVKDEQGNLIPSYSDKFNIGGGGNVAIDYSGTSGTYIVPSDATAFEMSTIGNSGENRPVIRTIVIHKNVSSVALPEFGLNRDDLTSIVVSKDNEYYSSDDGILYDAKRETLLFCPPGKKSVKKFPDTLKYIANSAFAHSRADEIILPDTVVFIDDYAFSEAKSKKIVLPESIERIGSSVFMAPSADGDEKLKRTLVLKGGVPAQVNGSTFNYFSDDNVSTRLLVERGEKEAFEKYLSSWGMFIASHRLYSGEKALELLQTENGLEKNYIYDAEQKSFIERVGDTERLVCYSGENGIFRFDENENQVLVKWTASSAFADLKEAFSVEPGAFNDCSMMVVRISDKITSLPENTFEGCYNLKAVISYSELPFAEKLGAPEDCSVFVKPASGEAYSEKWGAQVKEIFSLAESYSPSADGSLISGSIDGSWYLLYVRDDAESISIPSYVNHIYAEAAMGRTSLKTVSGGAKVTTIGDSAFKGCSALNSIVFTENLTEIGESAFEGCSALIKASNDKNNYIYLQKNVEFVGKNAFKACSSMRQVYWYGKASEIPESCFEGCLALTWFTYIDQKLTGIGANAFSGCNSLISMATAYTQEYLWVQGSVESVGENAFKDCSSLTLAYWYTAANVPASCFEGCRSLAQWYPAAGALTELKILGDRAFYGCSALKWFLGGSDYADFEAIGSEAFYGCAALDSLHLLDSINSIGENAFGGRGGAPIAITMTSLTPPDINLADYLDIITIFVPDSENHEVYGAYREAWEDWLGENPERILKTPNGAENEWIKPEPSEPTEPDPEPDPEPIDPENPDEPSLQTAALLSRSLGKNLISTILETAGGSLSQTKIKERHYDN